MAGGAKRFLAPLGAFVILGGCTQILGIDDFEKVDDATDAGTGGVGTGGAGTGGFATGGVGATGGTGGTGGSGGTGGTGGAGGSGGSGGTGGAAGAGGSPMCTPPIAGPCDTAPQCGCSGGENCVISEDGSGGWETACVNSGNTDPYHSCSVNEDCTEGHSCVGGTCKLLCDGDTPSCPNAISNCLEVVDGMGTAIPGNFACTRGCSPETPQLDDDTFDPCGPGLNCGHLDGDGLCFGRTPAGSGRQGDSCDDGSGTADIFLCAPGFQCVDDNGNLVCWKTCRIGGDLCSDCTPFNPSNVIGGTEFGVCPNGPGCPEEDLGEMLGTVTFDNTNGPDDHTPICVTMGGSAESRFLWTAPADGRYSFDTLGTSFDTIIALYDGCMGSELECNDDAGSLQSVLVRDMSEGEQVMILVEGFEGATGAFDLTISRIDGCGDVPGAAVENCSFENDLNGWNTQDVTSPLEPLRAEAGGFDAGFGLFTTEPTDGTQVALHGFDGAGPGTIEVWQEVLIPTSSSVVLEVDYRGGWDLNFGATQPRTFDIIIEPMGGGTPLQTVNVLTAGANTMNDDTGPLTEQVDMLAHVGDTVRIKFSWNIPEDDTGPGLFQIDNVSIY